MEGSAITCFKYVKQEKEKGLFPFLTLTGCIFFFVLAVKKKMTVNLTINHGRYPISDAIIALSGLHEREPHKTLYA